ncbi:MAG: hypothetical protein QM767_29370 [Anaeromyxobacter sp.]
MAPSPVTPPPRPTSRLSDGAVLRTALVTWGRHLASFSVLSLVLVAAPPVLLLRRAEEGGARFAASVLVFALLRLHAGAVTAGALRAVRNGRLAPLPDLLLAGVGACWRLIELWFHAYWLPLVAASLTAAAVMALASATDTLGPGTLPLAAVCGLAAAAWPLMRVFTADAVALAEPELSSGQAVQRSAALARGRFAGLATVWLVASLKDAGLLFGIPLALRLPEAQRQPALFVLAAAWALLTTFDRIAGAAAYDALRKDKSEEERELRRVA